MKRIFFFLLAFSLLLGPDGLAQKFGYIDTEFITSKMPEYQKVQAKMDDMTKQWIKEIEAKKDEVAALERAFKLEELLLTEDLRQQRLQQIKLKDQEAKLFQNTVFGAEGKDRKSVV